MKMLSKLNNLEWTTKLVTTKKDILGALDFYIHFNVKMRAPMKRVFKELSKKGTRLTLEQQKTVAMCLFSDIAARKGPFGDSMMNSTAKECIKILKQLK